MVVSIATSQSYEESVIAVSMNEALGMSMLDSVTCSQVRLTGGPKNTTPMAAPTVSKTSRVSIWTEKEDMHVSY